MQVKFIEATDRTEFNWGKFMVSRFSPEEREYESQISPGNSLLRACGWHSLHILVTDLQTGEGAVFFPFGVASADLSTHQIWVCPMFEPFLTWLYEQSHTHRGRRQNANRGAC